MTFGRLSHPGPHCGFRHDMRKSESGNPHKHDSESSIIIYCNNAARGLYPRQSEKLFLIYPPCEIKIECTYIRRFIYLQRIVSRRHPRHCLCFLLETQCFLLGFWPSRDYRSTKREALGGGQPDVGWSFYPKHFFCVGRGEGFRQRVWVDRLPLQRFALGRATVSLFADSKSSGSVQKALKLEKLSCKTTKT